LEGYTNVDLHQPADVVGDFMKMRFEHVIHVEMSHVLEHLSWRRTPEALSVVHDWLTPGGTLRIEVPDLPTIMKFGSDYPGWELAIYGEQGDAGEFHLAGFSVQSLVNHVAKAKFVIDSVRTFQSEHPQRAGYPCIELHAHRR
jgi:hypothetical protein